jgi:hypothetical protein
MPVTNQPNDSLPEAEQLRIACDPRFWRAGRDTSLEALHGNDQARVPRVHFLDAPVKEAPQRYGNYSEMKLPKNSWTIPKWPARND